MPFTIEQQTIIRQIIREELAFFIRTGNEIGFPKGFLILDGGSIKVGTSNGSILATGTDQKIAFHNATPVIQRANGNQALVTTTPATQTSPWGYASAAQADGIVTLVNELRTSLVEKGLIKGSA